MPGPPPTLRSRTDPATCRTLYSGTPAEVAVTPSGSGPGSMSTASARSIEVRTASGTGSSEPLIRTSRGTIRIVPWSTRSTASTATCASAPSTGISATNRAALRGSSPRSVGSPPAWTTESIALASTASTDSRVTPAAGPPASTTIRRMSFGLTCTIPSAAAARNRAGPGPARSDRSPRRPYICTWSSGVRSGPTGTRCSVISTWS